MSEKQIRSGRTSAEQYTTMVDFIELNKIMVYGKTSPSESKKVEELWHTLATKLNSCKGPQKPVDQWKRTFIDYKSKVKSRARETKKEFTRTGGGPKVGKPLTDLEERFMGIIGYITCAGDPNLPEVGLIPAISESFDPLPVAPEVVFDADDGRGIFIADEVEVQPADICQPSTSAHSPSTSYRFIRKTPQKNFSKHRNISETVAKYEEANKLLVSSMDGLASAINNLADTNKMLAAAKVEQTAAALQTAKAKIALAKLKLKLKKK